MALRDFLISGIEKLKKFASRFIPASVRQQRMYNALDDAIVHGWRVARQNAPVKTGHLRKNIQFETTRNGETSTGRLFVDLEVVPYARRQEYEHATKAFFMFKGYLAAREKLNQKFQDKAFVDNLFFDSPID